MSRIKLITLNIVLVIGMAGAVSACGDSGGGSRSPQSLALPEHTENEFFADTQALEASENQLGNLGLKYQDTRDSAGGRTYSWDMEYLNSFGQKNPQVQKTDMIKALEAYVKNADQYLAKYSTDFQLKKNSGQLESKKLIDEVREVIKVKSDVAKRSIEALRK